MLSNAVQEYQCIYDKSNKSYKDNAIISNIWKKVVEKVDVNVFSAVKVNQPQSLLFPHLAALKIQSFFVKNDSFKDTKHIQAHQV